ncbi:MAG: PRC-barrel domain-containing protein [Krumholzibacteria bacterium]|nr:PRC-barrel domain-containing protein [Candidatus Krumholzibacteria bacterium]
MDAFVAIGEVVKAVGLRGEVKLYPLLDFHEPLLDSGFLVWQDGTAAGILRHRPTGGGCVALLLEGSEGRDRAEELVGRELGFLRASYLDPAFPRPRGGLAFRYLGRRVVTATGDEIGTVDEVRRAGGPLLLVVPDGRGEILIPAVAPILRPDDGLEGDLVVDVPEGLLDVNRE